MSRLLRAIERRGFLQRDYLTGKYKLGWEILRLTGIIYETMDIRQVCLPYLHRLETTWDETATLCVLDGADVVNVDQVRGHQEVKVSGPVGRRTPIHSTGAGKALVAWLPEPELKKLLRRPLVSVTPTTITDWSQLMNDLQIVRKRGFATNLEENDIGVNAAAAPIRDHNGDIVAALTLSGPAYRLPPEKLERISADLVIAAANASRDLGHIVLESPAVGSR